MSSDYFDKTEYKEYLKSEKWKNIREQALIRAEFKCEKCGSTENLQCHHKNYRRLFYESLNDLIILCGSCHHKEHFVDIEELELALSLAREQRKTQNIFSKILKEFSSLFCIEGLLPLYFIVCIVLLLLAIFI